VPDARARGELLKELADAGWLFTDLSGYASPIDDQDEEAEPDD
jgi:hypothetical protein